MGLSMDSWQVASGDGVELEVAFALSDRVVQKVVVVWQTPLLLM